jgi:hypothetical protein
MKKLNLFNQEKMKKEELKEINGGAPWVSIHKGSKGRCICSAWCGSSDDFGWRDQGESNGTSRYHERHYQNISL